MTGIWIISTLTVMHYATTNTQLSSFYSCKNGKLLSWDDPSEAYNRREGWSCSGLFFVHHQHYSNHSTSHRTWGLPSFSIFPTFPEFLLLASPTPKWSFHQLPSPTPFLWPSLSSGSVKTLSPLHAQFALMGCGLPWEYHVPSSFKWNYFLSEPQAWEQEVSSLPGQQCFGQDSLLLPDL